MYTQHETLSGIAYPICRFAASSARDTMSFFQGEAMKIVSFLWNVLLFVFFLLLAKFLGFASETFTGL